MRLRTVLIATVAVLVAVPAALAVGFLVAGPDRLRPLIEQRVLAMTGRELRLAGPIGLALSLRPTVTLSEVSFANASWGSRPAMATIGRVEVRAAILPLLRGRIEIERLAMSDLDLLLETDAAGQGNWQLQPAGGGGQGDRGDQGDTGDRPSEPPFLAALHLERAKVTRRDGRDGPPRTVVLDRLDLTAADPEAPLRLNGRGSVDGQAGTVAGSLPGLAALVRSRTALPIDLTIVALGMTVSAQGEVMPPLGRPGIDLALRVSGPSLEGLLPLVGKAALPPGAVAVSARLQGGPDQLRVQSLVASLGESDLAGDLRLVLAGRPKLTGSLTSRRILLPEPRSKGDEPAAGPGRVGGARGRLLDDTPLDLAALNAADLVLDLALGELRRGDLVAREVGLHLALEGGRLAIEPLTASVARSTVTGRLALDASAATPVLVLSLRAPGMAMAELLASLGEPDRLEGRGDLVLRLDGRGGSVAALAGSLAGAVTLGLGQGRLRAGFLDSRSSGLRGLSAILMGGREGWIGVTCGAWDLPIQNGVVTLRAAVLDTDVSTVTAGGTVDLRRERLELKVRPTGKLAALGLPVAVEVEGSLASPEVRLDKAATARAAAGLLGSFVFPPAALASLVELGASGNPCIQGSAGKAEPGVGERAGEALQGLGRGLGEGLGRLLGR